MIHSKINDRTDCCERKHLQTFSCSAFGKITVLNRKGNVDDNGIRYWTRLLKAQFTSKQILLVGH